MKKKRWFLIMLFFAALLYYGIRTINNLDYYHPEVLATHASGEQFVGTAMCLECHADIYAAHLQTAHYHTSAIATSENIQGSFEAGANTLELDDVELVMKADGPYFYQHTTFKNSKKEISPERLDIVIGSGVIGKSYLTWEFDYLFQLQASYYSLSDRWINSPGYPPRRLIRPIGDGCLKCHMTFAKNLDLPSNKNRYDKSQMLYGIGCERCHGPAAKHVIYHRKNPDAKAPKFILKLNTLARQRRLDLCAQCHSGLRENQLKGNPFSYLPGEDLSLYSQNYDTGQPNSELDVHGNQYGLLTGSKCFKSTKMDCSTCHDPHKNQRGNFAHFNKKCRSCHNASSLNCTVETAEMNKMGDNCVSCHMPKFPSNAMSFQVSKNGPDTPAYLRTHLIGIYPKDTSIISDH